MIGHHPARARGLRRAVSKSAGVRRPLLSDDLTARRAGVLIGATTLLVAIAGGILMRVVDRHEFPTIGGGLWWSVQTITSVGYGDHVPTATAGKLLATVVMLAGIGFLSVVTASISAVFIESARKRRGRREAVTLEEIAERLDRIERQLEEQLASRAWTSS